MKKITILFIYLFAIISLAFSNAAFSAGKGVGQGGNPGVGNGNPGKPAKFEKFDKAGIKGVSNVPPGLQNKGLPPGLSKKDKVPAGWNKGDKDWDDENAFRRGWNRFVDWFK